MYDKEYLIDVNRFSSCHRPVVEKSEYVLCFHCRSYLRPGDICEWIDEDDTAICPRCGVDSIIPLCGGFPIDDEVFIDQMNLFWFGKLYAFDPGTGEVFLVEDEYTPKYGDSDK